MTKCDRILNANTFLEDISKCGRRFFQYNGNIAKEEIDDLCEFEDTI